MNFVKIRPAYHDEGILLTELTLRSKSYWKYSLAYLESCRSHLCIDEDYIKRWPVLVLERADGILNQIIGYYSLKIISGEQRLDNLWIDLPYIGKGFGKIAILHALGVARDLMWDHFYLASEPGAVLFYQKCGGLLVGQVPSKLEANLKLPHIKFLL